MTQGLSSPERNSKILWINLEFLDLEFLKAFCVYRNSKIPYRDPRVKPEDDLDKSRIPIQREILGSSPRMT